MADATSVLNEIVGALEGLATQAVGTFGDDRSMLEMWGWNIPALDRHELADFIRSPSEMIRAIDAQALDESDIEKLRKYPARIQYIRDNSLQHLPGGNAGGVWTAIQSLVAGLLQILARYNGVPLDLQAISDKKILPAQQLRELRAIGGGIRRLGMESAELEAKVAEIRSAHAIAEALPADIQSLEDARRRYDEAHTELGEMTVRARAAEAEVDNIRNRLAQAGVEAENVVRRANEAYGAATTVGLGKAFSERAGALNSHTFWLGLTLVATLVAGGLITWSRIGFVQKLMLQANVGFEVLWLNVTLTALSVSAPIWLAWFLTRQIGQRFRLAEDYGYKATLARAYEGYRAEAAHIDPELQRKLFAIALDGLAEAPLRLVEKDSPGSPAHDGSRGLVGWMFGRAAKPGAEPEKAPA